MIPVRNIYYMLAYAFQTLESRGWASVAAEDFDNVAELCAAILARGVADQVRRGLNCVYVPRDEELQVVRGRIDIPASTRGQLLTKHRLVCVYDEFSVDSMPNRALKATMRAMLRTSDVSAGRKRELRNLLMYFDEVTDVPISDVNWSMRYDRGSRTYRALIGVCRLFCEGLIQTQRDGSLRVLDIFDEQYMHRLYEKFILEYYRREHRKLRAEASQIPWALGDGDMVGMLPTMQTDITLSKDKRVLIIDAKYYAHNTQVRYGARKVVSGNLYQMFTYVKNREAGFSDGSHEVSGMLLYAKTDDAVQPSGTWHMSGNRIDVATLDLNADFPSIAAQLNGIVCEFFGE